MKPHLGTNNLTLSESSETILMRSKPAFSIRNLEATSKSFILNGVCTVTATIDYHLVESVRADNIAISVNELVNQTAESSSTEEEQLNKSSQSFCSRSRHSSMSSVKSNDQPEVPLSPVPTPLEFDIQPHIEMAANNKTIITTSLVSRSQTVKRTDSGPSLLREREAVKEDFDLILEVEDVLLEPGENKVTFSGVVSEINVFVYLH